MIISDFHLHSKYSRATSRTSDLEGFSYWAKRKGVDLLGTGDFTHPKWFSELQEKLKPISSGVFEFKGIKYILTTEISCIYSKNNKTRKIHILIFAPSFDAAKKLSVQLSWIGNIKSDGRPILGLDVKELVKITLDTVGEENSLIVPAHIWTPWFSLFGANSGFDSLRECFEEFSPNIHAIETGLSSDPAMNFRVSSLDSVTIISNSDAHSPSKIGREATILDLDNKDVTYKEIISAIKNGRINSTIEFFPEEGKYHFDGHRKCNILFSPTETKKHHNICPVCKRPLTVGVMSRVEELADREEGFIPGNRPSFKYLIPLEEIIACALGMGKNTKTVQKEYEKLVDTFGNEFGILREVPKQDLKKVSDDLISEGIMRVREEKVNITPGYDGVYGKIKVFDDNEVIKIGQQALF